MPSKKKVPRVPSEPAAKKAQFAGVHYQGMQRFIIKRAKDVSGTSGVGIVGEGVKFSDGSCAYTWLSGYKIHSIAANIDTIIGVHGHGGNTWVEFEDEQPKEHQ